MVTPSRALREQLAPHARVILDLILRDFFRAHHAVRRIEWDQFVDDAEGLCGVSGMHMHFASDAVYSADAQAVVRGLAPGATLVACDELADCLGAFAELLVAALGGTARVVATRVGLSVYPPPGPPRAG